MTRTGTTSVPVRDVQRVAQWRAPTGKARLGGTCD